MLELRQAAAELIANPLVPVPPLEGVVARARAYRAARRRRQVGAGLALVTLVVTAVARATIGDIGHDTLRTVGDPARHSEEEVAPASTTTMVPGFPEGSFGTVPWSGRTFDRGWDQLEEQPRCPVVRPAKPEFKVLARDVSLDRRYVEAVERLIAQVNANGGICGRLISVERGSLDGRDLTQYVAVLGLPFDDKLDAAIADGYFAAVGTPVISGDGLTQVQHQSPLVYPVGPSAAAMTRTAIQHAKARGAKSFAIVYDRQRAFGREAAASFEEYVGRHGDTSKASIPWDPSADAYSPQSDRLTSACGVKGCDFVLLALAADSAKQWLLTNPTKPHVQLAGLSPMLSDELTDHCAAESDKRCDGLVAWSGFEPWTPAKWWSAEIGDAYGTEHDPRSVLRSGAVVAARVLREALELAGPDATRMDVRRALDALTFQSQVTAPLTWPGDRLAQGWSLRTTGKVPRPDPPTRHDPPAWAVDLITKLQHDPKPFWHPTGTGWVRDPG